MKHRVLIVDDSPFVRRLIKDWLDAAPEFEVVGCAKNGAEGVSMAASLKPDLITLDVEMPEMNGIEALKGIMEKAPCPVVMVSSVTKQGAAYTIQALELGAVDFVTKPDGPSSLHLVHAKDELLGKCRAAVRVRKASLRPSSAPVQRHLVKSHLAPNSSSTDKVVVIASSTGGPRALTALFQGLPKGFPAPMLIVQHMPVGFTDSFAKRLDQIGTVPVKEAVDGDRIVPGLALLCRGGVHMEVTDHGTVRFNDNPPLHGVKPSADYLFKSAANVYGSRCMGVVLTGMGRDGAAGAKMISDAKGLVLAESEESAVIYGMPKAACEAGAVDEQFPIEQMASAIVSCLARRNRAA